MQGHRWSPANDFRRAGQCGSVGDRQHERGGYMSSKSGWCNIRQAAAYAGVCERTFEEFLADGLLYSMPRRIRLVRYADIDAYLEHHLRNKKRQAAEIARDILRDLTTSSGMAKANV